MPLAFKHVTKWSFLWCLPWHSAYINCHFRIAREKIEIIQFSHFFPILFFLFFVASLLKCHCCREVNQYYFLLHFKILIFQQKKRLFFIFLQFSYLLNSNFSLFLKSDFIEEGWLTCKSCYSFLINDQNLLERVQYEKVCVWSLKPGKLLSVSAAWWDLFLEHIILTYAVHGLMVTSF